jgi:hypothetical protein
MCVYSPAGQSRDGRIIAAWRFLSLFTVLSVVACTAWGNPAMACSFDNQNIDRTANVVRFILDFGFNQSSHETGIIASRPCGMAVYKSICSFVFSAESDISTTGVRNISYPFMKPIFVVQLERFGSNNWPIGLKSHEHDFQYGLPSVVPLIDNRIMQPGISERSLEFGPNIVPKGHSRFSYARYSLARSTGKPSRVEIGFWLGSQSNDNVSTVVSFNVDFASESGTAVGPSPKGIGANNNGVPINNRNRTCRATKWRARYPSYIRRNGGTVTVFGESSQNIAGQDVDVSYDGHKWFHLFGPYCLKGAPKFQFQR